MNLIIMKIEKFAKNKWRTDHNPKNSWDPKRISRVESACYQDYTFQNSINLAAISNSRLNSFVRKHRKESRQNIIDTILLNQKTKEGSVFLREVSISISISKESKRHLNIGFTNPNFSSSCKSFVRELHVSHMPNTFTQFWIP